MNTKLYSTVYKESGLFN